MPTRSVDLLRWLGANFLCGKIGCVGFLVSPVVVFLRVLLFPLTVGPPHHAVFRMTLTLEVLADSERGVIPQLLMPERDFLLGHLRLS